MPHKPQPLLHRAAPRPHAAVGAAPRKLYRKATFASPLCFDRSPMINALLADVGSPEFPPVAPGPELPANAPFTDSVPIIQQSVRNPGSPNGFDIPPLITPPSIAPPIIMPPSNGSPPRPPAAPVPEPASWILMLLGFGLVGSCLRRREAPGRAC